jgi:hypothetical protein
MRRMAVHPHLTTVQAVHFWPAFHACFPLAYTAPAVCSVTRLVSPQALSPALLWVPPTWLAQSLSDL